MTVAAPAREGMGDADSHHSSDWMGHAIRSEGPVGTFGYEMESFVLGMILMSALDFDVIGNDVSGFILGRRTHCGQEGR
jgi:hypothetical protein